MGVIFATSFLIEAERRESEISQFAESREEDFLGSASSQSLSFFTVYIGRIQQKDV
ncbi:MAG: hypothetical protein PVG70_19365 [Desulfobacterales bacterium]|jgi:hypothetical protein